MSKRQRHEPAELAAAGHTSEPVFGGCMVLQSAVWAMRAPVDHNAARRAIAATILAAAAVEALINDVFVELHGDAPHRSAAGRALGLCAELSGFIHDWPREGVLEKIRTIATAFGKTADFGLAPLQDMALLTHARNHLVHHLPERVVRGPSGEFLETDERFTERFRVQLFGEDHEASKRTLLVQLLEMADRRWPIETAGATLQLVDSWIPDADRVGAIKACIGIIWERYSPMQDDSQDGLPLSKTEVHNLISRVKGIVNAPTGSLPEAPLRALLSRLQGAPHDKTHRIDDPLRTIGGVLAGGKSTLSTAEKTTFLAALDDLRSAVDGVP